ncbi:MAG: permease [bacterium]
MEHLGDFKLIFTDVLVEAVPFLALGVLVSFLFELFLPEDFLRRLFAGRTAAGVVVAAAAGFVFPVSEYCIVPVARKLRERGVPLPVALTLMVAGPSLSPVVVLATSVAFPNDANLVYLRFGLGFPLVVAMGLVFLLLGRGAGPAGGRDGAGGPEPAERLRAGFDGAVEDFVRMLGLLVFACLVTAGVQAFIPHELVHKVAENSALGVPAMMLLAFVTSTCSESDAFIAAAFAHFSHVSKLAFLLLGPVVDLKLVLMHFAFLPRRAAVGLLVIFPLLVVLALAVVGKFI